MARRIKAMGIKMVLSGEGADEIFGGYLYFHKAPDARAFHEETVRKLQALTPTIAYAPISRLLLGGWKRASPSSIGSSWRWR